MEHYLGTQLILKSKCFVYFSMKERVQEKRKRCNLTKAWPYLLLPSLQFWTPHLHYPISMLQNFLLLLTSQLHLPLPIFLSPTNGEQRFHFSLLSWRNGKMPRSSRKNSFRPLNRLIEGLMPLSKTSKQLIRLIARLSCHSFFIS